MKNHSFIATARASRTINNSLHPHLSFSKSIFIGFYNGEEYLDAIERQLASQNLADVKIIVADNFSNDRTWEKLQTWLDKFSGQISLVRNPINVGAAGTLALNLDLFEGKWFGTFHQDDHYEPNHIEILNRAFQNESSLDCVFTEMGSMNQDREKVEAPARPFWFLPDTKAESIFLGNIRTHLVTWPSAGFRIEKFAGNLGPWHSAAFADTEIALKLSLNSRIQHLNAITMQYMENPESESHSLQSPEKNIGAALGLVRVLSDEDFQHFAENIQVTERSRFSSKLNESIYTRLGKNGLANFVALFAQEKLNEIWEYSEQSTLIRLSRFYQEFDGQRTSTLLSDMAGFLAKESQKSLDPDMDIQLDSIGNVEEWQSILAVPGERKVQSHKAKKFASASIKLFLNLTPRRYRKKIKIALLKTYIVINPKHPWNFK